MLSLPVTLTRLIVRLAPLLSKRVWDQVQVLLVGVLLAPGKRTLTSMLRVMGLSQEVRTENSEAMIQVSMIHLLLKRLA